MGESILRHPHFLPYLQYFIYGSQLPSKIIDEIWHLASDFDLDQVEIRKFTRNMRRQFELNPRKPSEEFFKPALECGMDVDDARSAREAMTIR